MSGPLPIQPSAHRDRFTTTSRRSHGRSSFFPGYAYGGYVESGVVEDAAPSEPVQAPAPTGWLRLDVTPGSAQVFVDGYYAGTVDDIERHRGLTLGEGPHRIEVRGGGYESHTFDVRIPAHDTVTYRGALDPERPPAAPAVSHGPTTIYVIPGCYMGNVPPREERVAPGCDVRRARIVSTGASREGDAPGGR